MASKEPAKIFRVKVRGQYHSINDVSGTPTLKNYEETFDLPSQEGALSTICKHLLAPRLRKSHPDFIRFRTHEKISTELLNYKPNSDVLQMGIDDMNILQLHDFCILRQIEIDPYKHSSKDIFAIRAMVQNAWDQKRRAVKDASEKGDTAKQKEIETLQRANGIDSSTEPSFNINEQKVSQAKSPAEIIAAKAGETVEADEPLPEPEDDAPLE